jgi:hypothetical protein
MLNAKKEIDMNKIVNADIAKSFGVGRAGPQDEPDFDPKTHKPNKSKSGDGYGVPNENPMGSKCGPMNDSRAPRPQVQALKFSTSARAFMMAKAMPPTPEIPEENNEDSSGDLYGPDGATPGGIDPDRGSDSQYEETYEGGGGGRNDDFLG